MVSLYFLTFYTDSKMTVFTNSPEVEKTTLMLQPIIEALSKLDYGQSVLLPIEFDFNFIEETAKEFSKGKKAYVVVKHDDEFNRGYELAMLPCGQTRTLFYALTKADIPEATVNQDAEDEVMTKINKYLKSDFKDVKVYGVPSFEIMMDGVIPYPYIQRTCVSLSAFKKGQVTGTKAIINALTNLIDKGKLIELDKKEVESKYGIKTRAFKLAN